MRISIFLISALILFSCGQRASQQQDNKELVQKETADSPAKTNCHPAADYLAEKFAEYNIITIDEGPHSTLQTHAFLRHLFESRKFARTVQYVVLEFLNKDYQKVIDRYIAGETVDIKELRESWRQGTGAHSTNFEKPVYMKLLEAIRNANSGIAANEKIRLLAGDPSINWKKIHTMDDYFKAITQRDVYPGELAIKYGIDSGKNVLLIYGGEHLGKLSSEKTDSTYWTIPFYINKRYPNAVFTIAAYVSGNYPATKISCPVNSIMELANDSLGLLTKKNEATKDAAQLKDIFDAVYYPGPSKEWIEDTFDGKLDASYWEELNRRSKIIWGQGIDQKLKEK